MATTITAYYDFVPDTLIKSSQVDQNFLNHRGTQLPITNDTATASNLTYGLGTTEYRWLNTYTDKLFLGQTTTSWSLQDATTTVDSLLFQKNSIPVLAISSTGLFPQTTTSDLGGSANRFQNAYSQKLFLGKTTTGWNLENDTITGIELRFKSNGTAHYEMATASFSPMTNSGFDLGRTTARWNNIYNIKTFYGGGGEIYYSTANSSLAFTNDSGTTETLFSSFGNSNQYPQSVGTNASYTVDVNDALIRCTGNNVTFTLPANADATNRFQIFKNEGTGILTLDPNSTETFLDGDSQKYLSEGQTCKVYYNGTNVVVESYTSLVGYLDDHKAANTAGGAATTGVWFASTLNTATGDFSKFGVLSSSVLVLEPGRYRVNGTRPFYRTDNSKTRLFNVSDSTTSIVGRSVNADTTNNDTMNGLLSGTFAITASKNHEFQYRVLTSVGANDLGIATNAGEVEVYAGLEIEKLV